MEAIQTSTTSPNARQILIVGLSVLAAVLLLFSLDRETHSFMDLMKPENLGALLIYFLPTFLICLTLLVLFARKWPASRYTLWSLLAGIPLSFTLIIIILMAAMGRL